MPPPGAELRAARVHPHARGGDRERARRAGGPRRARRARAHAGTHSGGGGMFVLRTPTVKNRNLFLM